MYKCAGLFESSPFGIKQVQANSAKHDQTNSEGASDPEVIKNSCLTQLSRKNSILGLSESEKC